MRKYILGIVALLVTVTVIFAFTTKSTSKANEIKKEAATEKPLATPTWYKFKDGAPQTIPGRQAASNYTKITGSSSGCTNVGANECAVLLEDDYGTTPNFSGVTFAGNGMPQVGGKVLANEVKATP